MKTWLVFNFLGWFINFIFMFIVIYVVYLNKEKSTFFVDLKMICNRVGWKSEDRSWWQKQDMYIGVISANSCLSAHGDDLDEIWHEVSDFLHALLPERVLVVVDPEFSHEKQWPAEEILALCSTKTAHYYFPIEHI